MHCWVKAFFQSVCLFMDPDGNKSNRSCWSQWRSADLVCGLVCLMSVQTWLQTTSSNFQLLIPWRFNIVLPVSAVEPIFYLFSVQNSTVHLSFRCFSCLCPGPVQNCHWPLIAAVTVTEKILPVTGVKLFWCCDENYYQQRVLLFTVVKLFWCCDDKCTTSRGCSNISI